MNPPHCSVHAIRYCLRLVIAGSTARSRRTSENIQHTYNKHLSGPLDLEIIDVYQQPELAIHYQVIAAPTLVKLPPLPVRRIIGDPSNKQRVLRSLDLLAVVPDGSPDGW